MTFLTSCQGLISRMRALLILPILLELLGSLSTPRQEHLDLRLLESSLVCQHASSKEILQADLTGVVDAGQSVFKSEDGGVTCKLS